MPETPQPPPAGPFSIVDRIAQAACGHDFFEVFTASDGIRALRMTEACTVCGIAWESEDVQSNRLSVTDPYAAAE